MKKLVIKSFVLGAVLALTSFSMPAFAAHKYVNMDLEYDGSVHKYSAEEMFLYVNGRQLNDLTMPPILLNDYTLVPAREVFEGLGAGVEWLPQTQQVKIYHENTTIVLSINSTTAFVNDKATEIDVPAKIINDKTMVPLRFISQALDKEVGWDGVNRIASVNDKLITTETTTETTTQTTTTTTTTTETTTETTTQAVQNVNKIEFDSDTDIDVISISGEKYAPEIDISRSTDGKLLTIDVKKSVLNTEKKDFGKGSFIKNGFYYQYSSDTIRISIDMETDVKYSVSEDGNVSIVTLDNNITDDIDVNNVDTIKDDFRYVGDNFIFENNQLTINDKSGKINLNKISYEDDYINRKYKITIPVPYVIDNTSFYVNNGYINSVDIDSYSSGTVITIDESKIMTVVSNKSGNNITFKFVQPKDIYKKILVLDAGHGGDDVGALGNGLVEKDLTLDMLTRTVKLFENDGEIKVYCTRVDDAYPSLTERQEMASELADVFVSIHINSATSSSPNGTETYCLYPNDQGNGLTSYILAEKLKNNLINQLGTNDRGVKSNTYVVLKGTKPSTLLEIGFISNESDAEMMASATNRQKVAQAIFMGVKDLLSEYQPVR